MASLSSSDSKAEVGDSGKSVPISRYFATPSSGITSKIPDTIVEPSSLPQLPSFSFSPELPAEESSGLRPQSPFRLGQTSNSTARLSTPPVGRPLLSQGPGGVLGENAFTFRFLYNASPTPSPRPSPTPSPQTLPSQPPGQLQTDFGFSSLTLDQSSGVGERSTTHEASASKSLSDAASSTLGFPKLDPSAKPPIFGSASSLSKTPIHRGSPVFKASEPSASGKTTPDVGLSRPVATQDHGSSSASEVVSSSGASIFGSLCIPKPVKSLLGTGFSISGSSQEVFGPSILAQPRSSESGSSKSLPAITKLSTQNPKDLKLSALSDQKKVPKPYNVSHEEAPPHPLFTFLFQSAMTRGLAIARDVEALIQGFRCSIGLDDDLRRLLSDAEKLNNFACSDTRTVAILGDSGQGKSSLVNSLLHFPGIAKTGDIGSACTSVVTEYRHRRECHSAPITIEVEYLKQDGIENMVKELLWSYRQLFLPGVESDATSEADYARYTRESDQAWSALEAAFSHRSEFKKELLQDMSEGSLEKIQELLVGWAREIKWPSTDDAGFWKSTATSADECCEKTNIFMQDRYWPFTKIIRIYVSAKVLKTGLVLADLPGLQDTNLARVRATQEYLLKCNSILLVTNISRAITDQSLKSSLYKVLSRHIPVAWEESGGKGLNLAVVCTKSEDINLKAAKAEFCGPSKPITKDTIEQLDKELEDAKNAGHGARKKEVKWKQQMLLMQARNRHVEIGLQKAYASKVPGGELDVFCVSNTMYEKYAENGNGELVRASRIPELRQFCYSITAEAHFREASHFLRSELLNLLNSLQIWASTGGINLCQPQTDGLDDSLYPILDDVGVENGRKQLLVRETGGPSGIGATQYYGFCLNNGHHETSKRPREDWNAKILWKMRMELEYQWDLVEDEIPVVFDTLLNTVKTELNYVKDQLKNSSSSKICDTLLEGVDARIRSVEYSLELLKGNFATGIRLVRSNASESNSNSFVLSEMIPAYRSASSQRGKSHNKMSILDRNVPRLTGKIRVGNGRDHLQKEIVQGRIKNGTLFPNISVAISDAIKRVVQETEKSVKAMLSQQVGSIKDDLCLAITSERHSGDAARRREVESFAKELTRLKEHHFAMLESITSLS
ncbi:hypothetical protein TruAng_003009 [Truncatella angustata]|nr:hypothetical protein TruAng_003009 [Truncatella angustata]